MSIGDQLRRHWPKDWPLQPIPPGKWSAQRPTYRDASPALIKAALERSQRRPTGNWFTFAASREVRSGRPFGFSVAGIELVAWRDQRSRLCVGPRSCPHLGADLATAAMHDGNLICRWHGLCLGRETDDYRWRLLPSYDDGVLVWVRLDAAGGEQPLDHPVIPARPSRETMDAVATMVGTCEPSDIIANRLDPWHGAWYHPYSFTQLEVLTAPTEETDSFLVAVAFRIGPVGVPTVAEFTSPEARTVVMRIVDGEGVGSVVETHATPVGSGPDGLPRTAVIEATIAHSERTGFRRALSAAPVITPLMRVAAARLWKDDLAYAERRYQLRAGTT